MKKEKKELTLEEKVIKRKKIGSLSLLIILLFSLVAVSYSLGWSKGRKSVKNDNLEVSEPLHLYDYYNKVDVNNVSSLTSFNYHFSLTSTSSIFIDSTYSININCNNNSYLKLRVYDNGAVTISGVHLDYKWSFNNSVIQQQTITYDIPNFNEVTLDSNFDCYLNLYFGVDSSDPSYPFSYFCYKSFDFPSYIFKNVPLIDLDIPSIEGPSDLDDYVFYYQHLNGSEVLSNISDYVDEIMNNESYYQDGYDDGYSVGYSVGFSQEPLSIGSVMNSIFRAPYTMFHDAFDFELPLGNGQVLDVGGIMMFLLTIGICLAIVSLIGKFK